MILWDGSCIVHEAFSFDKIISLFKIHPNSKFIAHPESQSHILYIANFIGSTSALLNFVKAPLQPSALPKPSGAFVGAARVALGNAGRFQVGVE